MPFQSTMSHDTTGNLYQELDVSFTSTVGQSSAQITNAVDIIINNYDATILSQFDLVIWSADIISKFINADHTLLFIVTVVNKMNTPYNYSDLALACVDRAPDITYAILKKQDEYNVSNTQRDDIVNKAKIRYQGQQQRETDAPASLITILLDYDPSVF